MPCVALALAARAIQGSTNAALQKIKKRKLKKSMKTPNAVKSAEVFGCTVDQAKRLFQRNADEALEMIKRAKANGGRYNSYSIAQLIQMEREYRAASVR